MEPAVGIVGDALIDVVTDARGAVEHPGGAGLNVAVGIARLGGRAMLAAPFADDARGRGLRRLLGTEGVEAVPLPGGRATGVAESSTRDGEPSYSFSDEIRNRHYTYPEDAERRLGECRAVVVTSFPMGDPEEVERLTALLSRIGIPVAVDANARAALLPDRDAYRRGFERLAGMAALVKVSTEDLGLLYGDGNDARGPGAHARGLLYLGAAAVVETAGARGATVHTPEGRSSISPPPLPEPVVNSMGAGDALMARLALDLGSPRWPGSLVGWPAVLGDAVAIASETCRIDGALLQAPDSRARSTAWN
ncbi:PfkB family carbohydrate kinase [Leucobacter chromiisoli]|nr:PfkB family carbohydrate kinase [Leucobacter chromiisoli]